MRTFRRDRFQRDSWATYCESNKFINRNCNDISSCNVWKPFSKQKIIILFALSILWVFFELQWLHRPINGIEDEYWCDQSMSISLVSHLSNSSNQRKTIIGSIIFLKSRFDLEDNRWRWSKCPSEMEPPLDYSALRKPSNKKGKELENSKFTPSNLDFANPKVNLNYSFKESAD